MWFWWEEQNSMFPITFFGGCFLVFIEYFCNHSPKIQTKNIKKFNFRLAIVYYWNWLDDSPPLKSLVFGPTYSSALYIQDHTIGRLLVLVLNLLLLL